MCKLAAGNGGHKMSWYSWFTVYKNAAESSKSEQVAQGLQTNQSRMVLAKELPCWSYHPLESYWEQEIEDNLLRCPYSSSLKCRTIPLL